MSKCQIRPFIPKVLRSRKVVKRRRKRRNKKENIQSEPLKKNINLVMNTAIQPEIKIEVKDVKPIRKRFYRCCVPNCTTYGTSEQFNPFPSSDSALRRLWIDTIPRKNWIVCHNTQICKNHFNYGNGKNNIPELFPQKTQPNLEDKYGRIDKGMFQISSNYALPETFGELALLPNCDKFIFDFFTLKSKYKEHLKVVLEVCKWITHTEGDQLIFYRVYSAGNCIKVSTSIMIDTELKPTIALEGVIMDPLDITRHIPVNGRITHWNQLNLMLLDYGHEAMDKSKP